MAGPFVDPEDLFDRRLADGVNVRLVSGERIMLCEVTLEAGSVVPRHQHPHEQAGRCLEGEFELEVDGVTRTIRPGDSYMIPGGVPHSARAHAGRAVTLDIFSPPRDEYLPGGGGLVT